MVPSKYARSETMTPGFERTIGICIESVPFGPHTVLLDVPCGKGEAIVRLAPMGCRPIGLDRSPQLLAHAADKLEHEHGQALLVLADGGCMPIPDDAIDICLSIGGPSCIGGHSVGDALREQARVLKSGGYLVMSDMFMDESDPNPWLSPDHPDAKGWWNLLEGAGLRVVNFEHFAVSAWDEYHDPMRTLVAETRRDHPDDAEKMAWADEVEREIELDLPKGDWANYGTFVAQKL